MNCSNLSLIYPRFRVNSRQDKVRTCNMFHCLTSSLLSSTSTHLSQVQLENITLQQLTCFASHSSSLPRTKFILGSCHDKNTWNTRQRYLDECAPYQADIEKCFRTSVQFPHKATPSVRNSGSVSPLPRANPAESASWKARQWGVSSRITAPLDTWQMKMRQQERTKVFIYTSHALKSFSTDISQNGIYETFFSQSA